MNKKLLYILIVSICISLLGIIMVQFFWIRNAFQVREAQFSKSVNDALGSVVNKIETRENMYFISRNFEGDSIMRIVQAFTKDTSGIIRNRLDSLLSLNDMPLALHRPPPPPPPPKRRSPAGVVHYSYQYNVVPVQSGQDSITFRMEQFYQETQAMHAGEFNFEWDDQIGRIDSLMEMNADMPGTYPGGELTGPENTEANEIIIETPDAAGSHYYRYRVPQSHPPTYPPQATKIHERQKNNEGEQHPETGQ